MIRPCIMKQPQAYRQPEMSTPSGRPASLPVASGGSTAGGVDEWGVLLVPFLLGLRWGGETSPRLGPLDSREYHIIVDNIAFVFTVYIIVALCSGGEKLGVGASGAVVQLGCDIHSILYILIIVVLVHCF